MKTYQWMVIGAGPAGIASVGQLLQHGVAAENIVWIDPQFRVGDLGLWWRKVESNTPVESFNFFYKSCDAFRFGQQQTPFFIEHMQGDKYCPLLVAAEPLHWITQQLRQQVLSVSGTVTDLQLNKLGWQANVSTGQPLTSQQVILAIGSQAKPLYFKNLQTIPLVTAFDPEQLAQIIQPDDCIAVFGASQSARNVIENLHPLQPKRLLHFYRNHDTYDYHFNALDFPGIEAYEMSPGNLITHTPTCNKAIYAIGFEKRPLDIGGLADDYSYDKQTGIIAPGLYGIGIAFPEILPHRHGQAEYPNIAIAAFIERLQHLLPYWLSLSNAVTQQSQNSCSA